MNHLELPERSGISASGAPTWRADGTLMVNRLEDTVGMMLDYEHEIRFTPEQAEEQALMLLAAARYDKENQT